MSRRIDIELTSARDDGTWTWRAAGARQPKGVLDGGLLYPGATAGDVVRAEADFEIEGITIISVIPPKAKPTEPERLEIIGPPREAPGVTSSLVPRRERDGDRRGPRRGGESGDRGGRPGRPPRDRGERSERAERPDRARTGPRAEGGRGTRPGRPAQERPAPEPKPKEKRLNPGNAHRAAALEALPPEQRPIAEQVLRGGVPAVRTALEQDNARAREEGRPEVPATGILRLAEDLLPKMKAAEWHDRAEAAVKAVDDISLRDLRAVVAGADASARDEETRTLASTLREALERRLTKQREDWLAEVNRCLDEGRLVRALRVAARPPDASSRFPSDLATRLSDAASAALSPDAAPDRWATVLDAVAASPVRRSVKPVGLPAEPGEALLQAARQQSGRVPALAAMLGIDMPPPPGPPPGTRGKRPAPPRRGPGGSRPGGRPGPAPAATTQGASEQPQHEEPTEVGALASPDPAAESAAAATPELTPVPAAPALAAPTPAPELATPEAPPAPLEAVVPAEPVAEGTGVSDAAPEANTAPAPTAVPEPDSPAEAVAAQLLREQAPEEADAPAEPATGADAEG